MPTAEEVKTSRFETNHYHSLVYQQLWKILRLGASTVLHIYTVFLPQCCCVILDRKYGLQCQRSLAEHIFLLAECSLPALWF